MPTPIEMQIYREGERQSQPSCAWGAFSSKSLTIPRNTSFYSGQNTNTTTSAFARARCVVFSTYSVSSMLFFPRFLMQQLAMKLRIYDALNNAMTSYTTLNASRLYKTHGLLTHRRLVIEKKNKAPERPHFNASTSIV